MEFAHLTLVSVIRGYMSTYMLTYLAEFESLLIQQLHSLC